MLSNFRTNNNQINKSKDKKNVFNFITNKNQEIT